MTIRELMRELDKFNPDAVVICMDEIGRWDNIEEVKDDGSNVVIVFGGDGPFSDGG